ncbi:MAG: hypothetical protein EB156_00565 [Euryarchaeota archaeon]|nr:hypothetical protein [Euryarchaeota archaeon]NDB93119.1 hypothetical protein [Euryarchaeota archaeon]NDF21865.1 hypothetical protein [Euryarchaeota archaeon]NDF36269.1 hypothetical protein [Euryarchaeota archaeon]NDG21132.1 hypothetical protein [Euryarchaeota archaeon]
MTGCPDTRGKTCGLMLTGPVSCPPFTKRGWTWSSRRGPGKRKPRERRRQRRLNRPQRQPREHDRMVNAEEAAFLVLAAIAIGGAIGCVYARRVAHSLLSLMMTFLAVAGVFILAEAEMLAAVQILVYLGSVMLVVQFGVMLTRRQIQEGDIE